MRFVKICMLFYVFQSILVWNWIVFMPDHDGTAYFQAQGIGSAKKMEKISLQKMKAEVIDGDLNRNGKFSNP